jgi:3-dehydroquinate synthase
MQTLIVDLGERSYPIYIGSSLLGQPDVVRPHIPSDQVLVVSDEQVAPLYLQRTQAALSGLQNEHLVLPTGEAQKSLATLERIFDVLIERRFDRSCTLIALGGGVVGDLTGFAAASYQRGVNFIQIPTTLLSQVDSSVGGKTGVNHPRGKNMIGAFYQPGCVVADTQALTTLPDRELSAGLAEIVKYGLIRDLPFLEWLEDNMDALLAREPAALVYAIHRSCQNKAAIVALDERESGQRALLNLGHTFGHAIETALGYGRWLHGEAVAAGLCMAAELSVRLGCLDPAEQRRIERLVQRAHLPASPPPEVESEQLLDLRAMDKKVRNRQLRLVLMQGLGHAVIRDDVDPTLLRATLDDCRDAARVR